MLTANPCFGKPYAVGVANPLRCSYHFVVRIECQLFSMKHTGQNTDDTGDTGLFLRSELICSLVDVGKSESLTSTAILVNSFPDQKVIPTILQIAAAVFHQLFALLASKQLLMSSNLHLCNELHKKRSSIWVSYKLTTGILHMASRYAPSLY